MKFVEHIRSDELLRKVLQSSTHLLGSNAIGLGLSVIQSILAARLLGPAGYGLIAIVMSFVSTVNGLLSFRMGELVVRYGGEYLEKGDRDRAAAVIKIASMAELAVSTLAFAVVVVTAGLGARYATKTPGTEWMFLAFSVGLLCNFNSETATGILQITGKLKKRATVNLIQTLASAAVVGGAYLWGTSTKVDQGILTAVVLGAYLAGKVILGIGLVVASWSAIGRVLGPEWRRARISSIAKPWSLLGFAVSSNLSATAILVFRESEVLWVGLFLNSEAAGLYKVAYMIVILLSVPADPLILSVHPELNRLVVLQAWDSLRSFLRRVTTLAGSYNVLLGIGLAVLGGPVLGVFGEEYRAAYPALLVLLAGLVFNYTFFWNRPLLLAFGLQRFALGAVVFAGILKLLLAAWLVPRHGYVMEAALLSGYFLLSVGLMVWRGLRAVGSERPQSPATAGA